MDGDLSAALHRGVAMINDFAFFLQFFDVLIQTKLGDSAHGRGAYFERHPLARFRHEEFFCLQVRIESAYGFSIGVGDVVASDSPVTRQVTNLRHKL